MFVSINRIYENTMEQNKSHLLDELVNRIGKYMSESSSIEREVDTFFIKPLETVLASHASLVNRKLITVENHYQNLKDRHGISVVLNGILRQENTAYLEGLIAPFLTNITTYCMSLEPHMQVDEMQSDVQNFLKEALERMESSILEELNQVMIEVKTNGYYSEETVKDYSDEKDFYQLFESPYDALMAELNESFSISEQKIVEDLEKASKIEKENGREEFSQKSGLHH